MKQKILEALKAKFQGSNANVLSRIADKLAKTATTEEQANTAVAGVTQELLEVIESYGDSRATEAQQTAVQNYESKYGLKEGKPTANGGVQAAPKQQSEPAKPQDGGADDVPAWAKALLDANKSLTERLNKMDTERTTTSRKQTSHTKLMRNFNTNQTKRQPCFMAQTAWSSFVLCCET